MRGPGKNRRAFVYAGLALLIVVLAAMFVSSDNAPTAAVDDSGVAPIGMVQTQATAAIEPPAAAPSVPPPASAPEVSATPQAASQQFVDSPRVTQPDMASEQVAVSAELPVRESERAETALPPRQPTQHSKILSFEEALTSANAGDAYSQAVVSLYFGSGYKTAKNELRSKEYAMESARQRNPLGIFRLGEMRRDGIAMAANQKQAADLFKKALPSLTALEDDPYALAAVGRILELNGDIMGARNYYVMSAQGGYGPAQLKCADLFALEDRDAAERYRSMAAEQGLLP